MKGELNEKWDITIVPVRPLKNIGMALLIEYLKVGYFLDNLDIKKNK